MQRQNDIGTTQRILLGLVIANAVTDPVAAKFEAAKLAKEECNRQKTQEEEAKFKKQQAKQQQPKHTVSHERQHKHPQTKSSMKRY